jgi:hypothetical protein
MRSSSNAEDTCLLSSGSGLKSRRSLHMNTPLLAQCTKRFGPNEEDAG